MSELMQVSSKENSLIQIAPDGKNIPGFWNVEKDSHIEWPTYDRFESLCFVQSGNNFMKVNELISKSSVNQINENVKRFGPKSAPVSKQGIQDGGKLDDIGSYRVTMWNPVLANFIEDNLIKKGISKYLDMSNCGPYTATDWWQGDKTRTNWAFYGVSPMLRYMEYKESGEHYPHYDAGYIYPDDNYRTLKSFVLYLSNNESGFTQIIRDYKNIWEEVWNRDHSDWSEQAREEDIVFNSVPRVGAMLIFNHRECHSAAKYLGDNGSRIIIRGDLIYKAVK